MAVVYLWASAPQGDTHNVMFDFAIPYFWIAISLNVLLTLLIITRLVVHERNIRSCMRTSVGGDRLYRTIVIILIESCGLYTVAFLLFIVSWCADSVIVRIFWPVLTEIQVCTVSCFPHLRNLG
jgi:hypothetical protein